MGYLLKYRTRAGPVEFAFDSRRKDDAIVQAAAAVDTGARDVELLENGKRVPKSEWAQAGTAKGRRRHAPA